MSLILHFLQYSVKYTANSLKIWFCPIPSPYNVKIGEKMVVRHSLEIIPNLKNSEFSSSKMFDGIS